MEKETYLADPCGASSLPFWKTEEIRIPEGITEIADDAFEGCPSGLIIYGRPDTLAHDYARAHHYIFAIDPIG